MRELKILYRKEWLIYLTYVLAGIGTPIVMTLLMMTGNSEEFSGSFNGVYNNTLLLSGIGTMLHLEHENCQLEVGCFVVNRKRYMKFRILQMIVRAIVLSMVLILATKLWRVLIPGGAQYLDTSYTGSDIECCLACGLILILINSVSLLDSVRKKPLFSTIADSGKKQNSTAVTYRPEVSKGKRLLAGLIYLIVIVIWNLVFQIIAHAETVSYRVYAYAVTCIICVGLWIIAVRLMGKKELG